jgi:aquaporin Z
MNIKEFAHYVVAQVVGATLGAILIIAITQGMNPWGFANGVIIFGSNGVAGGTSAGNYLSSIALEIVLTFTFVFVILWRTTSKKVDGKYNAIFIGITLMLVHMIGINFTGTSVNPARSFGPALVQAMFGGGTTAIAQFWVFLVGPLAGAVLAVLAYNFIEKKKAEQVKVEVVEAEIITEAKSEEDAE